MRSRDNEDNIMIELKWVVCEGAVWIHLAEGWPKGCLMRTQW